MGNKLVLLWHRLKHDHLLLMALCCLVPIGLLASWLYLFRGGGDYWGWLILGLCLLFHLWMMRSHSHEDHDRNP